MFGILNDLIHFNDMFIVCTEKFAHTAVNVPKGNCSKQLSVMMLSPGKCASHEPSPQHA